MQKTVVRKEDAVVLTGDDISLVHFLAADLHVAEAAKKAGLNHRTAEGRILRLKQGMGIKTLHGLVAEFYKRDILSKNV